MTEWLLAIPFTVHTSYANAMGRSSKKRIYAFITTANGIDLETALVAVGLARAKGVGRKTPSSVPRDEMGARLRDDELAAALRRVGVWSAGDPERISELRAAQRQEEQELQAFIFKDSQPPPTPAAEFPIAVNTASVKAISTIKGVGPALAQANRRWTALRKNGGPPEDKRNRSKQSEKAGAVHDRRRDGLIDNPHGGWY